MFNYKKRLEELGFQESLDYFISYNGGIIDCTILSPRAKIFFWKDEYIPNDNFNYKIEERNGWFRMYKTNDFRERSDFNRISSNFLPLGSFENSLSMDHNLLKEEIGIFHEMQITPNDDVSLNAYAFHRKKEGGKIIEKREILEEDFFQSIERQSNTPPKIMEVNMEIESSLMIKSKEENFPEEFRNRMIEEREQFNNEFTEEMKAKMREDHKQLLNEKEKFLAEIVNPIRKN